MRKKTVIVYALMGRGEYISTWLVGIFKTSAGAEEYKAKCEALLEQQRAWENERGDEPSADEWNDLDHQALDYINGYADTLISWDIAPYMLEP